MTDTNKTPALTHETIVSGAAFRDFYQNHWPSVWYVEEFYINFEDDRGEFILPDDAQVKLGDLGWAAWQGQGEPAGGVQSRPIADLYIEVMGGQATTALVTFRVPESKLEELRAAASALGATEV